MKGFVCLAVGAALMFISFTTGGSAPSSVPGMTLTGYGDGMAMMERNRKLKQNGDASSTRESGAGGVNLEDYQPIDPVPSSKASIKHGPIQHGTPLMPFIPKPSPPGDPKCGGFP